MCLNQVEFSTNLLDQPVIHTYQKLNLAFLFSPFCFDIENVDTKMYLHGF